MDFVLNVIVAVAIVAIVANEFGVNFNPIINRVNTWIRQIAG